MKQKSYINKEVVFVFEHCKTCKELSLIHKKWIESNLEKKYNLFSEVSSSECSLNIFNKNNNNYLLVFIILDENDELRVYTDDDYLVIKINNIINFLQEYMREYFSY